MTDVECHNCGYEWSYSGSLEQTTCPSCGLKTPVEKDTKPESEEVEAE